MPASGSDFGRTGWRDRVRKNRHRKGRLNLGLLRIGDREMNDHAGIKSSRSRMRVLTVITLCCALPAIVFLSANFADAATRNLANAPSRHFAPIATNVHRATQLDWFNQRHFAPITKNVHRATQLYWFNQPTVSPYLNLTIHDPVQGLPNYHTLVRPRLQRRQSDMQRRSRPRTRPAPLNASSLHRYYPGLRR